MSNEYKDRMLQLLTEVDNVQAKEAALQLERKRHQDQITQSEADLQRTEDDIGHCREEALGLRRAMDELKDQIFHRDEPDEPIMTEPNNPDGTAKPESEAHRLWVAEKRRLQAV